MGAGIVECEVTFTKGQAAGLSSLAMRSAHHDEHPGHTLSEKMFPRLAPGVFNPDGTLKTPASARCCTSDITLAEFKTLQGKMDAFDPQATTVEEFMGGTPTWRTDLYASKGTLLTHAESIDLFKRLQVKMTPELKAPSVPMPFEGT